MIHMKRSLDHPQRAKMLAYLAAENCVTPEHFLSIVKKRKVFRAARAERQRARKRNLVNEPKAKKKLPTANRVFAGDGPLYTLLRMMRLGNKEFCRISDIGYDVFKRWYGHPMHGWPVRFLELLYYARGMEKFLQEKGIDTMQFRPVMPEKFHPSGRYPRKSGDLEKPKPVPLDGWTPYKGKF